MAARLSALRTGLLYPQETSWYSFLLESESTPGVIVRLEGLGKLKKSTSSGTRTGDLRACSIVPQPTTPPCAPRSLSSLQIYYSFGREIRRLEIFRAMVRRILEVLYCSESGGKYNSDYFYETVTDLLNNGNTSI
jgi:hypothetical protein